MADNSDEAYKLAIVTSAQLESHEKTCIQRYGEIKDSFGRVHDRMDGIGADVKRIFYTAMAILVTFACYALANWAPWLK